MRFYYDCEFIEDGRTIDLISIGVVAEDGSEFYAVNKDAPWKRIYKHDWLMANVFPSLPRYHGDARNIHPHEVNLHDPAVKAKDQIARELLLFLRGPVEPWWPVELWADYGAYDHVVLCQLFGAMVDLPAGLPMWTHDFRQYIEALGIDDDTLPKQEAGQHNALADARHLRIMFREVS